MTLYGNVVLFQNLTAEDSLVPRKGWLRCLTEINYVSFIANVLKTDDLKLADKSRRTNLSDFRKIILLVREMLAFNILYCSK